VDAQTDLGRAASYALGDDAPECDMVMKGGITSGVVYPRAACRLATRYRLRRVGGSSAGAIAATMVAAAEHGRGSVDGGYVRLNSVPDDLGAALPLLFQPSAATTPALAVLHAWVDPDLGTRARIRRTLAVAGGRAPWWGVLAFLLVLVPVAAVDIGFQGAPGDAGGAWRLARALAVWAPLALAVGVAGAAGAWVIAALRMGRSTIAGLEDNGFGLCDGHHRDPAVGHVPLTDWMTDMLDELAGRAPGPAAPPLTFGDLWGPAATDAYRTAMSKPGVGEASALSLNERRRLAAMRRIDVVVMTTDLSHRRPYHFPFDTQIFLWCPSCLGTYFPERVMAQLRRLPNGPTQPEGDPPNGNGTVARVCPVHQERLWPLPLAVDIPVVVAARLSLSFPGLISAVPLYAVDFATVAGTFAVKPVWFSDGGITSNFPMQFFDQPLPGRPTFGINLMPLHPHSDKLVWRPGAAPMSGSLPRHREIASMFGFAHSILDTMQNWVDNLQISTRGFNDRVAEVRQRPGEGGMNLEMPNHVIQDLADRGAEAAATFDDFDFDDHRLTRFRIAMAGTDELLTGMHDAHDGYDALLAGSGTPAGLVKEYGELVEVADTWREDGHPAHKGAPRPQPQLRLVPRL
jgi:predicted acylesterase/phospholipase RssA